MLTQHRVAATCLKGKSARSILAGALGWWDASTYTSGAWVNGGTAGSVLDFTRGAAAANPSFAAGEFTFDGTDDYMYISDNATLTMAAGQSYSFGLILSPIGTFTLGERIMSKDGASNGNYLIRMTSGNNMISHINDAGTSFNATGGTAVSGAYTMYTSIRNVPTLQLTTYIGATPGTPTALTLTGALDNADELRIGGTSSGFFNMKVKAAYLFKRVLTVAELTAIKNYYGA